MPNKDGIILDNDRENRIGFDEAVLCEQKTPSQIDTIVSMSIESGHSRLFTRIDHEKFESLTKENKALLQYMPEARIAMLGEKKKEDKQRRIAIVSAGSSDAAVVAEAQQTLNYYGQQSLVINDVGVAGLWRLLERIDDLKSIPIVIAVAGMDAALPTVLAGLIPSMIIGVPTSTGYGAARNGETALSAMLASCGSGLTVVNIDNGYGAACAALRTLHSMK